MSETGRIYNKTSDELNIIKEGADILGRVHGHVSRIIAPGLTTLELDMFAEGFIKEQGAVPSFKGYRGFPGSLCISVNDVVVHGIPGQLVLKEGDIVSVDCGVYFKGFHSDSAFTYPVGNIPENVKKLLKVTYDSLFEGIKSCRKGNRVGDISSSIQQFVEKEGYTIVRELVGHGVGKHLHEKPEVPNFGKRGQGPALTEGIVLAIEPMVNMGQRAVRQDRDGWTIRTRDTKPSAHYEHTVAIVNGQPEVLTTFEYIDQKMKF
jgi:methionyl aminopeptidase